MRPTNMYEACHMAADIIANHHNNYLQEIYGTNLVHWASNMGSIDLEEESKETLVYNMLRADDNLCQSAFCRLGWVICLIDGDETPDGRIVLSDVENVDWTGRTSALFGYYARSDERAHEFRFDLSNLASGEALEREDRNLQPGTPEYAEEGAKGLRDFAEKWKERLTTLPATKLVQESDGDQQ